MTYREDKDLEILAFASNDELNILVEYLIRNEYGDLRMEEKLTDSDGYKNNPQYPRTYWKDIAAEIQRVGANKVATIIRFGRGILYKEELCDICEKFGINYSKKEEASEIERHVIKKMMLDLLSVMDLKEMKELAYGLGISKTLVTKGGLADIIRFMVRGDELAYYKIALMAAMYTAESRRLKMNHLGMVPCGIITHISNMLNEISPSYSVVIPAVVHISYIRAKYNRNFQVESSVVVQNKAGIHRRPASAIVQTASKYASEIKICAKGKTIDAKSYLFVVSLGLVKGTELKIIAKGGDAYEAVKALTDLINSRFGEEDMY